MMDLKEKLSQPNTDQERSGFDVSLTVPLARYVVKGIYAKREEDVELLKQKGVVPEEFNPDAWNSRQSQLISEILAKIEGVERNNKARIRLRMTEEDIAYARDGFKILPILGPVDGRLRTELEADFSRLIQGQKRRVFFNRIAKRFIFNRK